MHADMPMIMIAATAKNIAMTVEVSIGVRGASCGKASTASRRSRVHVVVDE